jgi:hypothetical protein
MVQQVVSGSGRIWSIISAYIRRIEQNRYPGTNLSRTFQLQKQDREVWWRHT